MWGIIVQSHNKSPVFIISLCSSSFIIGLVSGYLANGQRIDNHNKAHFIEARGINTSVQKFNRYGNERLDLIQSFVMLRELKHIEHPTEHDKFTPDIESRKLIANRIERVALHLKRKTQLDESINNENPKNTDQENDFVPIVYTSEDNLMRNFIYNEDRPEQLFELKVSIEALLILEEEVKNGNYDMKKLADLEQSHSSRLSMIAERILRNYRHRF